MKAHIERDPIRQTVRVWLYRSGPDGTLLLHLFPSRIEEVVEPGASLSDNPSLELPEAAFEALVAAGIDFAPPSSAQAEHLADAVKVRDRLLSLVEIGAVKGATIRP